MAASIPVDDDGEEDDGRTQVRQPLHGRVMVPKSTISGGAPHPADEPDPTRAYVHPADAPDPTRSMPGAPHNSTPPPPGNALGRIPTRSLTVEDGPSTDVPAFTMTPAAVQQPRSVPPPPHSVPPPALASTRPQMMDRGGMMQNQRAPQAPYSQPPPPMVAHLSGGYPQQQMGMPAPGMSQPAHFAVPRMAPSEGRIDPPATVLTQRNGSGTSRTMSWAAALMAVGVFVGLVAAVVAGGGSDTLADTSASFVDPARPSQAKRSSADQPKVITQPAAPGMPTVQVATVSTTQTVFTQTTGPAAPPPLVNAGITDPAAAPPAPPPPGMVMAPSQGVAPPPVAVAPPPAQPVAPPPAAAAPPPQQSEPVAAAPPPPKRAAQPAPAAPPPRRSPPPQQSKASNDDDGVAAAPPPKKPPPPAKGGGKGGDDDELKKAADALSKAQLENSL